MISRQRLNEISILSYGKMHQWWILKLKPQFMIIVRNRPLDTLCWLKLTPPLPGEN